jgi:uncharacterized protein (DUF1800 family)
MDTSAFTAMIRFGWGRRAGEALPDDPHAWLAGQLRGPDTAPFAALPDTAACLDLARQDREEKPPPGQGHVVPLFRADAQAQLTWLLATDAPFRERLVWFWANHFTVSRRQGGTTAIAGAYVREAIRPHIAGRFEDMLLAVMHHPAMLMYLDNAASIGPDSEAGLAQHRGLNENLARECLELHTVSPAAGYTQQDVTNFANILTGWSIELKTPPAGFIFRPRAHEPGSWMVMGRAFPDGEAGGVAALQFLANHPATHRFLATKLVRHFVADTPPPDAVRRIEGVLRDTRGDLGAAAMALVALPVAWAPLGKLRTPMDYAVAVARALDLPADKQPDLPAALGALGQPLFDAPLPNGWGDTAADWAAPEAMMRRIDWCYGLTGRAGMLDPEQVVHAALGPLVRPATLMAMQHAGSRRDALTLALASPEFQRR